MKEQIMSPDQLLKEARQTPLAQRSQRWWDATAVFGGIIGAVVWLLYSSIRGGREGYDLLTPLIMVLVPTALVLFRRQIDEKLLPLQKYKKDIPRMVLVGAGLAVPLVVAQLLYSLGFRMYNYLRFSIIVGTAVSYVILRTPRVSQQQQRPQT